MLAVRRTHLLDATPTTALRAILTARLDRTAAARSIADWIATERHYHWVGLYEVTSTEIGMIACTGSTPPAFPRFPVSRGLCGAAVAGKSIVNVGNVQADPRWLTTFGSTRSEIIIPVFASDASVAGLIDVESHSLNAFSGSDEQFLSHCATIISSLF
jgi:putative methionine-R-sulfoxide reductase with GAF domain